MAVLDRFSRPAWVIWLNQRAIDPIRPMNPTFRRRGSSSMEGRLRRFRPRHWVAVVGLVLLFALFAFLLIESIR